MFLYVRIKNTASAYTELSNKIKKIVIGFVIGWIHAAYSVLGFLLGLAVILIMCIYDCAGRKDLEPTLRLIMNGFCDPLGRFCKIKIFYVEIYKLLYLTHTVLILYLAILMILSVCLFVLSYFCIKGMYRRNHTFVRPMMVLTAVAAIFSILFFLEVFAVHVVLFLLALVLTVSYCYQFVVMYSIHSKFQNEFMGTGFTVQYHLPIGKI